MSEKPMNPSDRQDETLRNQAISQSAKDWVLVLSGPVGIFRLNKARIVIGSVASADVRLGGEAVAPIHAVIELPSALSPALEDSETGAIIYDLASETGVFVNGKKVITGLIKSGDKIAIGSYLLSVSLDEFKKVEKHEPNAKFLYTSGTPGEGGSRPLILNPNEDLGSLLLEDEREVEPIFDYRPAQKRALEVVMAWRDTVLNVEHFVHESTVTIGENRRSDFGIPAHLNSHSKLFPLVRRKEGNYILNIDAKMRGVIQRQGKLQRLEDIRGFATQSIYGHEIGLDSEDFAKISLGEVDFYLSFTAAPPRLKTARLWERDPFFLKVFWISMALTAVMLNLLWNASVPQNIEAEQIPERIATILYNPEKYLPKVVTPPEPPQKTVVVDPPKPEKTPEPIKTVKVEVQPTAQVTPQPVPREMNVKQKEPKVETPKKPKVAQADRPKSAKGQSEGKEGAGKKAKGPEGTRGQPKAKPAPMHQDKATRPGPQGGQGAGAGNSQVEDIGNVDLLNSATAKITDILGNGANRLGKNGDKLKGFGAFTTQGTGGLALSGKGQGGGGTADTTLGGLSDHGRGGGEVGTGKGAAGSGKGIIGGKVRVAIRTGGPEEAFVMGSIDKDAIAAAMQAHYDEFRLCYEKEVNAENPNLAGRVGTTFVIGSTGSVTQAGIESTTLKNANTERCILDVIRRIAFPIPRGAGIVQVSYPFKFNRSNGR